MNNLDELTQTHQKLAKAVSKLLESPQFITGDMEKVKNSFIDNLYSILQTAFDINITKEKLEDFLQKTQNNPTDTDNLVFLTQLLEEDRTYILLNYFFSQFILLFVKNAKQEQKDAVWNVVKNEGIDDELLKTVDISYASLIKPS